MIKSFRNLRFYRVFGGVPDSEAALSERLATAAFEPCGSLSERSSGFEEPLPDAGGLLCRRVAGADLVQLRLQTRILPVAAIREALAERVEAYKQRTRTEPSRADVRDFKEEVYTQLLPQALLQSERVQAFHLTAESLLVVGTASKKIADFLLEDLGNTLDEVRFAPVVFNKPVTELMSRVFLGDGPGELGLGRECRMRDPSDSGTSVNWLDIDIDRSVRQHVRDGLELDRLGMRFDHLLSFVIDPELVLRKVKLEGLDAMDEIPGEDPLARFDADFAIAVGTIGRLFQSLKQRLGGYGS